MGKEVYYGEGEMVEENISHMEEVIVVFLYSVAGVSNSGGLFRDWLMEVWGKIFHEGRVGRSMIAAA
jgi:hypothetical protein